MRKANHHFEIFKLFRLSKLLILAHYDSIRESNFLMKSKDLLEGSHSSDKATFNGCLFDKALPYGCVLYLLRGICVEFAWNLHPTCGIFASDRANRSEFLL